MLNQQITTPLKLLELVASKLEEHAANFAIAGGLAASFYRDRPRLTNDVDIAIDHGVESKTLAISLIENIGFNAAYGWISNSEKHLENAIALVIGRQHHGQLESTIDFLLPVFPWLPAAVERAQHNRINYGFAKLPTMTPEDVIIAKTFALSLEENRFQDMDDIQSIFQQDNHCDLLYLANAFERLGLSLPKSLETCAPSAVQRVSKQNRRKSKRFGLSNQPKEKH